jgi:GNAT superfamily N-acetyltransferase
MIRKAVRADYPRISEIRLSVRENILATSKYEGVDRTANWIFDNAAFWVWEEDGAIQGFSAADPRNGEIFALFIHPAYERRGIGRALLPLSCQILRDGGHAVATLTTEPGTRAERFYRRDGWTEIGREDDGQIIFQKALQ